MTDELYRFKTIVATIALEHPDMNMRDGIRLALEMEEQLADEAAELLTVRPPAAMSVKDPYDLAHWAWDHQHDPMLKPLWDFLTSGPSKKIHAIKEMRAATGAGLRESKDAVELIERYLPGRPPRRGPAPF